MRTWLALVAGALCAIGIACGGAAYKSGSRPMVAAPGGEREPVAAGPPMPGDSRAQIDALDREIDDGLAKLGIAKQPAPPSACITPPCDVAPMTAHMNVSSEDPTCKPGPSDTCTSSCKLSDAVCVAAGRICRIAGELGGNDAYANDKCETGKTSCKAALERCCGCT